MSDNRRHQKRGRSSGRAGPRRFDKPRFNDDHRDGNGQDTSPQPRGFAPGLAAKKQKLDPYASLTDSAATDNYTLLKDKEDAETRGTWSTVDTKSKKRNFDQTWYNEREEKRQRTTSTSSPSRDPFAAQSEDLGSSFPSAQSSPAPPSPPARNTRVPSRLNPRYENPDLDVDEEIRSRFKPVEKVLEQQDRPLSSFEQRNRAAMTKAPAAKVKVSIGGFERTIEQKVDRRAEHMDRFGNYVGANQGQIPKRLREERERLLRQRDEEMVALTREKREWEALGDDEREERLAKKRAPANAFALEAGVAASDVFEFSEMPDVYKPRKRRERSGATSRFDRRASQIPSTNSQSFEATGSTDLGELFEDARPARDIAIPVNPTSTSGATRTTRPSIFSSAIRAPSTAVATAAQVGAITKYEGPNVAKLVDVPNTDIVLEAEDRARFEKAKRDCATKGRVVLVTLHEPVKFSPEAIARRVFFGPVQEIQYHPDWRNAIVVFVFPENAKNFLEHIRSIQVKDQQAHRQAQVDVEWHGGYESKATYPIQEGILTRHLHEDAVRVFKIHKIPPLMTKEEVVEQLKERLNKPLVKVSVNKHTKLYEQKAKGNMAVVDFASIKDAVEAMGDLKSGVAGGFTREAVEWVNDPCNNNAPVSPTCECFPCRSKR